MNLIDLEVWKDHLIEELCGDLAAFSAASHFSEFFNTLKEFNNPFLLQIYLLEI